MGNHPAASGGAGPTSCVQADPVLQDVKAPHVLPQQAQQLASERAPPAKPRARACLPPGQPSLVELALQLLPGFAPCSKEYLGTLREWTERVHQPLPPEVRQQLGEVEGWTARHGFSKGMMVGWGVAGGLLYI